MQNKYQNYDPEIKRQIMDSGNPDLFPNLNIPRSTARYWIEKSKPIKTKTVVDKTLTDKIARLKEELIKERYTIQFLQDHLQILGKLNDYQIKKKDKQLVVTGVFQVLWQYFTERKHYF